MPDALERLVTELRKEWPGNRTITIVCHGHSVPSGYFKTPIVDTFNAYPHLWHRAIKQRYPFAVMNVIVTAIGGEHSAGGAERFERDVMSLRPDLITIDYGLNDRRLGLEPARAAWTRMIERAKAADIPTILLTPTADLAASLDDPDDPLNQHAEQIRELAATHELLLADSLVTFKRTVQSGVPIESLMSQGNHPNRAGHDLVTAALSAIL